MIKNLYCNGCSTMCGGGLEVVKTDILDYYKSRYGVTWETERDIMWPKLVADGLNLKIYDYSKSGAGIERYIRETYDYIYEDFTRAKETIYFIECPVIWNKIDVYSNKYKEYLICNVDLYEGNPEYDGTAFTKGTMRDLHLCKDYFYESAGQKNEIESDIKEPLLEAYKKTWNIKEYEKGILKSFVGLLALMKYKGYKFYILPSAIHITYIKEFIPEIKANILYLSPDMSKNGLTDCDFHNWASGNKMKIKDETDGIFDDTHPGYFAHQKWSQMVIDYLIKNKVLSNEKNFSNLI